MLENQKQGPSYEILYPMLHGRFTLTPINAAQGVHMVTPPSTSVVTVMNLLVHWWAVSLFSMKLTCRHKEIATPWLICLWLEFYALFFLEICIPIRELRFISFLYIPHFSLHSTYDALFYPPGQLMSLIFNTLLYGTETKSFMESNNAAYSHHVSCCILDIIARNWLMCMCTTALCWTEIDLLTCASYILYC